jgi:hypothetical protein
MVQPPAIHGMSAFRATSGMSAFRATSGQMSAIPPTGSRRLLFARPRKWG